MAQRGFPTTMPKHPSGLRVFSMERNLGPLQRLSQTEVSTLSQPHKSKCPRCGLQLLQDRKTKEWICINCGFGSLVPRQQAIGREPNEPDTKRRLELLNRVADQFGKEKVDEILKDDPYLKQLWQQELLEEVAMEFGKDKVDALVRDQPELKEDWESTAQLVEDGEPFWTEKRNRPSSLWYLVPILFSLLGGLIAYIALKDRDDGMADSCLIIGILIIVAQFLLYLFR